MTDKIIRVGTGILLFNDKNRFLMTKRKGSHQSGTWALVGGYLEFGETFEEGAKREAMEEAGVTLTDFKVLTCANYFFDGGAKHHITIYCAGRIGSQTPKNMEPHKCDELRFFDDWNDLPSPTFVPYHDDVTAEMILGYLESISRAA
jgi:8-oxo-dGTP diphosphatase